MECSAVTTGVAVFAVNVIPVRRVTRGCVCVYLNAKARVAVPTGAVVNVEPVPNRFFV